MKRIMIDLETLGVSKNACVVQIGAVRFDAGTGAITDEFKLNIDAIDAVKNGAVIDASTAYWWLEQSDAARKSIVEEPKSSERLAFEQLNIFLTGADEIWSHATFDFVIVMEALRRLGIKPSFSYRAARDIRTLTALSPVGYNGSREGTHHDALDDAKFQVAYCCNAMAALRNK